MSDSHHSHDRRRRLLIARVNPDDESRTELPADISAKGGSLVDEMFCAACGVDGAIVATVRHRELQHDDPVQLTIRRPCMLIGRGSHCDVSLQDPAVSYRHAYLQLLDGQVLCFDLASRSGTFCRSDRHRAGALSLGEEVFVGPFSLVFTIEGTPNHEDSDVSPLAQGHPGAASAAEMPETVLRFLNGSPRREPLALNRPVTLIGRHSSCRVRLSDDSVSRVHCSIVRTKTGVWAVDLLGRGGTQVGGQPVERARLRDRDELTVGGFRMQVLRQPRAN